MICWEIYIRKKVPISDFFLKCWLFIRAINGSIHCKKKKEKKKKRVFYCVLFKQNNYKDILILLERNTFFKSFSRQSCFFYLSMTGRIKLSSPLYFLHLLISYKKANYKDHSSKD